MQKKGEMTVGQNSQALINRKVVQALGIFYLFHKQATNQWASQ